MTSTVTLSPRSFSRSISLSPPPPPSLSFSLSLSLSLSLARSLAPSLSRSLLLSKADDAVCLAGGIRHLFGRQGAGAKAHRRRCRVGIDLMAGCCCILVHPRVPSSDGHVS